MAEPVPAAPMASMTVTGHGSAMPPAAPPAVPVPPSARDRSARLELVVGGVLTLVTVIGGVYLAIWPGPGLIDRWVLDVVPVHKTSAFTVVTQARFPLIVVIGAIVLAAVTVSRDRARALACLVGPPLALGTCELVLKPLVGRTLGGALSYPSGTAVAASALATAMVLATPARWRVVSGVLAGSYALWAALAVIALQWHLPTDALAGCTYGVGIVLMVDGLAWPGLRMLQRGVDRRRRPDVGPL
jgi:membrane-associated phospholipid phosphatase